MEAVEIDHDTHRVSSDLSSDGKYQYMPEYAPEQYLSLYNSIGATLDPLADATEKFLSEQGLDSDNII